MYHFIINPSASSGKGMRIWKKAERILKAEQVQYEAHILKSAAEVTALVQNLTGGQTMSEEESSLHNAKIKRSEKNETLSANGEISSLHNAEKEVAATSETDIHLVVLGGDGTLNAVLNGIVSFQHTILSCIRTGSGNDFARNMGVSRNIKEALYGILNNTKEIVLDYGKAYYESEEGSAKAESRRFIISSGVGYDADICEEVSRSKLKKILNKVHLGKLVYVAIGIKQIFTRTVSDAVLCLDDGKDINVSGLFFVVGMVHEREGGGVPFCPAADATDGLLDICLVRDMPTWKLLLAVILVYGKKHLAFQNITMHRCRRFSVQTEIPQWFHMDGETPCKIKTIEMECKSGLRFLM